VSSDDHRIISSVVSGDSRAFSVLVDRYKDRAFSLAVRLVGRREEAEEIVQDAFVKAFKGLSGFRGDARFGTWLHRIVYNLCMTRVSRRRKGIESLDDLVGEERMPDDRSPGMEEQMDERDRFGFVEHELKNLGENLRTPIILFYIHEMKYEEIAEVMGLPIGTVKTNLHRGRKLLRDRISSKLRTEMA